MKERPILFSGEMIRALLDGRKTQTRRVCKKAFMGDVWADAVYPADQSGWIAWQGLVKPGVALEEFTKKQYANGFACPYGATGDRLWVRETLIKCQDSELSIPLALYDAGRSQVYRHGGLAEWEWKASKLNAMYMPRWASRITLEIVKVRVEQVQDITCGDVIAEGAMSVEEMAHGGASAGMKARSTYVSRPFIDLWDSINAKRGYGWDTNPFCWVIEFKRIEAEAKR